jgi:hypothetical protein
MSKGKLSRHRLVAFFRQAGRCCYCGVQMWITNSAELAVTRAMSPAVARRLRCTAEHLCARSDGGADQAGNIAAACWHCNLARHRRKTRLGPRQFGDLVRKRVLRRKWHDPQVYQAGLLHGF